MPSGPHCTASTVARHAEGADYLEYDGSYYDYGPDGDYGYGAEGDYGYGPDCDEYTDLDLDLEEDTEEYGCWLVALVAVDGKSYVYRVYAPPDALLGDLFWEAWHCHDEGPHPRAYDVFDTASIRHIGNLHQA